MLTLHAGALATMPVAIAAIAERLQRTRMQRARSSEENSMRQHIELLINAAQKLQASPRGSEQPQLPFSEVGVRECALATCRCRYWEGATVTNAGCNACRDAIDGFQIGLFALRSPDAWGSHAGIRVVDRWVSAPAHKAIADRINRNVTNDLRFQKQRCPST